MRKLLTLIAGSLLIGGVAQAKAPDREAEIERAVRGRVAGEAVDCIDLHRVHSSRIIQDTAIVYDAGGVIYVNRPRAGAQSLDRSDTMVNRLYGNSRLCSIDTVTMIDPVSGTFRGTVFLGEFVPYRRVQTGSAD
ncbi:MAG TPA: hypothetical protein VLK25_13325 [Allosphingosinicella sp.]|nr:hypothetical protein [Allosphingosinicella sp.]